jgi:hypothetical protein
MVVRWMNIADECSKGNRARENPDWPLSAAEQQLATNERAFFFRGDNNDEVSPLPLFRLGGSCMCGDGSG